jgi:hypothetical protein
MKLQKLFSVFTFILILYPHILPAQNRGNNLSFQGFFHQTEPGVKAMAMGGAYLANTGDAVSVFYNPAGISELTGLSFSIAGNSHAQLWRENQDYRPNRIYWTMAFYFEGLYVPDPANNGVDDYILAQDTNYVIQDPVTGLEPYSEEAADWQKQLDKIGLNNVVLAYPFAFAGQKFAIGAAYRYHRILDFDRNDSYLDPHIGYDEYGVMPRVVTGVDTFSWSRFTRDREGDMTSLNGALTYEFNENLKIGLGASYRTGESTDFQSLERVGYFEIESNNVFRFSYDTVNTYISGSSEFSAMQMDLGIIYKFDRVSFGVTYKLPYTMTREWKNTETFSDTSGTTTNNLSGKDEIELPGTLSIGARFTPVEWFTFAADYQFTPYSKAKFNYSWENDTQREWVDQHILKFGTELRVWDFLSFMAGYRDVPATFVPDGAAIKDSGPSAKGYTLGASINLNKFGRIDLAYEYRRLRYYDSYFSNTNYVTESMNVLALGYSLSL